MKDITQVQMVDIASADTVEIKTERDGRIWVNVDGVCVLRVKRAQEMNINMPQGMANAIAEGIKAARDEPARAPDGGKLH